jgi:hypothetical protein
MCPRSHSATLGGAQAGQQRGHRCAFVEDWPQIALPLRQANRHCQRRERGAAAGWDRALEFGYQVPEHLEGILVALVQGEPGKAAIQACEP